MFFGLLLLTMVYAALTSVYIVCLWRRLRAKERECAGLRESVERLSVSLEGISTCHGRLTESYGGLVAAHRDSIGNTHEAIQRSLELIEALSGEGAGGPADNPHLFRLDEKLISNN